MGDNVFANGMEVSYEKSSNKSPASMPDVCWTPPTPPPTGVTVPYPNFSFASDTTDGTTTVQIAGGQVGKKNKSCYKKSTGDEAATKSLGKGLTTACIQGKQYFAAWSSDVKYEGENAVRFGDFTGSNHASPQANAGNTTANVGKPAPPSSTDCKDLDEKNKEERQKVVEDLEDKSKLNKEQQSTLDKAQGTGMTVSSAKSQVPGAEGIFSGCSSGCAQACNPDLVSGGTSEQKVGLSKKIRESNDPQYDQAKENAGVLCDKSHVNPGGGAGAHAEAKIANQMSGMPDSAMRGGSIVFSIDWRFKRRGKPKQSGMPCTHCHKMMCKAAAAGPEGCDIQIFICDKDGKPQPLTEDDCKKGGYENLSTRIDGNPKPGR